MAATPLEFIFFWFNIVSIIDPVRLTRSPSDGRGIDLFTKWIEIDGITEIKDKQQDIYRSNRQLQLHHLN